MLGYLVLRNLTEGLGLTVPTMVIVLCAFTFKIPLTYFFVFGVGEFEGLGGVGCGWSTAVTMWLQLLGAIVAVKVTRASKSGVFRGIEWPNFAVLSRLVRLGLPMGGTIFIEVSFFSCVTLFIGRLGVEAIAAHQIAMSVGSIGFMIPLALSLATTFVSELPLGLRIFASPGEPSQSPLEYLFSLAFALLWCYWWAAIPL